MGTESDAGMRSGVKRQATEADRRRVQATLTSRWAALCTGRKSKERAKLRGFQRGTATDGEEVGKRGEIMIQKTAEEKGGTGGIF